MKKEDYLALCQEFDVHFSNVKNLVEETEHFYNQQFQCKDLDAKLERQLEKVNYIGSLQMYAPDAFSEKTLPRLYFNKVGENTNPPFYLITTTEDKILYVGTSEEGSWSKGSPRMSVSATTGGVFPPTDTAKAYAVYLGLMCAVKHYGECRVYEICTGYENLDIVNQYGESIAKDIKLAIVPLLYKNLVCAQSWVDAPVINESINSTNTGQIIRNEKIWQAVSTFKSMVKNKIIPERKVEAEINQQIILQMYPKQVLVRFAKPVDIDFLKTKFFATERPESDELLEGSKKLMNNRTFWRKVEEKAEEEREGVRVTDRKKPELTEFDSVLKGAKGLINDKEFWKQVETARGLYNPQDVELLYDANGKEEKPKKEEEDPKTLYATFLMLLENVLGESFAISYRNIPVPDIMSKHFCGMLTDDGRQEMTINKETDFEISQLKQLATIISLYLRIPDAETVVKL